MALDCIATIVRMSEQRAGPSDGEPIIVFPSTLPPLTPTDTAIAPGHAEWVDLDEWEAPTPNHLSPFGQIEHFGAALRSGARRGGWQRTAVKVLAWTILLGGPTLAVLAWLLTS